jgi:hypothetical protein
MRPQRKARLFYKRSNIDIQIDKESIKEAIIESCLDIEEIKNQGQTSSVAMKKILHRILRTLQFVLIVIGCMFIGSIIMYVVNGPSLSTVSPYVKLFIYAIALFTLAATCNDLWKCIKDETDKNYIVSYTSAAVSLVALLISFIALATSA